MCNLLDCADRVFILQLVYKQNQIPSISTKMALKMPICILKNCALMLPSRSLQIGQIVHSVRMKSQCHGTWSNSQISPKNKHRPTLCFEDLFGIYEYPFFRVGRVGKVMGRSNKLIYKENVSMCTCTLFLLGGRPTFEIIGMPMLHTHIALGNSCYMYCDRRTFEIRYED